MGECVEKVDDEKRDQLVFDIRRVSKRKKKCQGE